MDDLCHSRRHPGARCPFYGFAWPEASLLLLHEGGNRCGLALDRAEPCAMEETGRDVDMRACPVADRFAHFIRAAGPVIVFLTPDHPEGLPYDAWLTLTMRQRAIEVTPQRLAPARGVEMSPNAPLQIRNAKPVRGAECMHKSEVDASESRDLKRSKRLRRTID